MVGAASNRSHTRIRVVLMPVFAILLSGFLAIQLAGCGEKDGPSGDAFTVRAGRVEPLAYKPDSGPGLVLAIKKEMYLPYLEVTAQFAPPFALPRRLPGRVLQFRVDAVKLKGGLDIYDREHAMENSPLTGVVWLNADGSGSGWVGNRQVFLSEFTTSPLAEISGVEGTLLMKVPVDPVMVEFSPKEYRGRYKVKGVRFEIEHLSSEKVKLLIFSPYENYLGMDAGAAGKWTRTLGMGRSFKKTSGDRVLTEWRRVTVDFPEPTEAIRLYFCGGFAPVEEQIRIQPEKGYSMAFK